MKKSIVSLRKQIVKLQDRIDKIQKNCKHPNVVKTHGGSTGNYDPSDNLYWTHFHCPDCDKMWVEDDK